MTVQRSPDFPKPIADHQRITDLALQSEFPGMLVSAEMEILQYRGEVGPFIQPAPGTASNHLFKMVRKELIPELRRALQAAAKGGKTVTRTGLTLRKGRGSRALSVRVIPVYPSEGEKRRFYLVLFEEGRAPAAPRGKTIEAKAAHGRAAGEVARLRRELAESLEYQGTLIEKYEATQENLTAANEELQSSNEELQSANEELETAKEELQSSNEELTTVNDELQNRNLEQSQLSNDLNNLLSSVEIAIIMLSSDRRIRRFTPLAGKVLNLISGDVGRPFSDLKLGFDAVDADFDLDRLVTEVLDTVTLREVELQDREGRWFRLQVRPYKTLDHRIDGVVLSFIDIDALKRSLEEIQRAKREAQGANRAKDLFLATLSHELRTPLTSILLWAQMLRSQSAEPEKVSKGLTIIAESAAIQNQLINDLLDVRG